MVLSVTPLPPWFLASLAPPLFSTINPAKIQHVASFVSVKHAQVGLFSLFYGPSGGTTGII